MSRPPERETAATARPLRRSLLAWYRRAARPLPWRQTTDPYRIWLSEILLQQTRVETARPYYERLVAEFPTVAALAAAPLDRVLKLWEGLGYYGRGRNLHRAAQLIVRERGGRLPQTAEDWQRLPGVGRYTAGAIASIACGEPVPAVDGNVKRVLARLFRVEGRSDDARTQNHLWELATELMPRRSPGTLNQALMELGARICTPHTPRCPQCPVRAQCAARIGGVEGILPRRGRRPAVRRVEAVAGVVQHDGRLLLVQRPAHGLLAGLWGWPAVESSNGNSHATTLREYLRRELGVAVRVGGALTTVQHEFTHRSLRLHVYACSLMRRAHRTTDRDGAKWLARTEIDQYALATLDRKVFGAIGAARMPARRSARTERRPRT